MATPSAFSGGGVTVDPKAAPSPKGLSALVPADIVFRDADVEDEQKITIICKGEKDSGKSSMWAGLPRPFGGKTVFLTFDDSTLPALENRFGKQYLKDNRIIVKELCKIQYKIEVKEVNGVKVKVPVLGTDGKPIITYPGFDPNRPVTSKTVIGTAMKELEKLEVENDTDNIVVDHFQELHENIGPSYALHVEGLDPTAKLEFQHYAIRKQVAKLVEAKARAIARHACVLTGYGEEEKLVMRKVETSTGGKKNQVVTEVVQPRWVGPYQRPYLVTVTTSSTKMESEGARGSEGQAVASYWCVIDTSKHHLFPKGARIDVTDKDASVFWKDAEAIAKAAAEIDAAVEAENTNPVVTTTVASSPAQKSATPAKAPAKAPMSIG